MGTGLNAKLYIVDPGETSLAAPASSKLLRVSSESVQEITRVTDLLLSSGIVSSGSDSSFIMHRLSALLLSTDSFGFGPHERCLRFVCLKHVGHNRDILDRVSDRTAYKPDVPRTLRFLTHPSKCF
jgi:hypothetical protein